MAQPRDNQYRGTVVVGVARAGGSDWAGTLKGFQAEVVVGGAWVYVGICAVTCCCTAGGAYCWTC